MECVHCTACIDACDTVMDKIGRPRGLIRYASLNGIERGEPLKITPRLVGYTVVLLALGVVLAFLLLTRSDVQTTILRAQGALFQQMPNGRYSNLYTVRVVNKTSRQIPIQLKLEAPPGQLQVMGANLVAPPQKQAETSLLIELDPAVMKPGTTPVVVGVYAQGRRLQRVKTGFIGPRDDSIQ
jgi:polyferredoxin